MNTEFLFDFVFVISGGDEITKSISLRVCNIAQRHFVDFFAIGNDSTLPLVRQIETF